MGVLMGLGTCLNLILAFIVFGIRLIIPLLSTEDVLHMFNTNTWYTRYSIKGKGDNLSLIRV